MPATGKRVQLTKTCRLGVVNQWTFIYLFFLEKKTNTGSIIYQNRALGKKTLPEKIYYRTIASQPSLV